MVSRCMVLFGITYLRLDIFIAWWMSIFQSILVLRHCVSWFVHHYILGHLPSSQSTRLFSRIHSPSDPVINPCELHAGAYPPSLGSSNLSQTSLSFDLVVDSYESHIGAFLPFAENIGPFTGFIHLFDLVVDPYEFHTGAYPPFLAFFRIIGPFTCFTIFWPSCRSSWVVILGHIPSSWVCLHHYLSHPLVLGHLVRSVISLSCQFEFSGPHLYRSAMFLSLFIFSLSRDRTYINRSFSMSVCVSGPHLYRSVIRRVSLCRDRTYIDRSSSYQFEFKLRPHPYRSIIHRFLSVQFLGPHLYRSVIILSIWVWVGAAPISIGHLLVMSVCVSGTAPISIGHCHVNLSRGRTYINQPFPRHCLVS